MRRALAEGCADVLVVDNFLSSEPENLPDDDRVTVLRGSIADDEVLGALGDTDIVFHLATYHGNQSSIADPFADHENNLLTTLKLYERLAGLGVARVVYASTGCALAAKGDAPAEPVVEDGPVPLDYDSPYQISKVVGEMYSLYYHRMHALPVVRARFQNAYGPGEVLGAGRWRGTPATVWRNVVPTFVYHALHGRPLGVHGDGSSTRDFVYVNDVVDGLVRCALADDVQGDVFNVASGRETTIRELAERVNQLTGNDAGIEALPERPWDRSLHRVGSVDKSRRVLGFEARVGLDDGLRRTVEWTRQNLEVIERCIARHEAMLAAPAPA